MACLKVGLTPKEAVAAATLNAAWAVGLAADCGSLAPGKRADVLVLNVGSVVETSYWLGENPVREMALRRAVASAEAPSWVVEGLAARIALTPVVSRRKTLQQRANAPRAVFLPKESVLSRPNRPNP